jgi:PAS domain S-box-containing protein
VKYTLKYLVDTARLQELSDQFHRVTAIPSSIVADGGEVLTSAGPREICNDFHAQLPDLASRCARLGGRRRVLDDAGPFVIFECPQRLIDASAPVMIEGEEVARVYAGPVFLAAPDAEAERCFREQARAFGLDEAAYLAAFRSVPVHSLDRFRNALAFLANMAQIIADVGLARRRELKAADDLRAGQERYRRLFNGTPVATAELDVTGLLALRGRLAGLPAREVATLLAPEGAHYAEACKSVRLLNLNAAARNFFAIPAQAETTDEPFRRAGQALAELVLSDIFCILAGKTSCSGEEDVRCSPDMTRHALWRWIAEAPDPDGAVRYLISFVDLTERRQAELALRESEQRLRLQAMVLDQIQDLVTVTDLTGRITYVNDAECRLLGKSREDLIGRSVESYGDDPTRGETQREIIRRTRAEGEWRGEVVNFGAAGVGRVMDCRTRLVRDAAGNPVALCGIATDITARKRADEDREKLQEQLHQALKMESIGRLAGGVAHDFNNQLAGIMGYADLLATGLQDAQMRHYAQNIVTAAARASELTRQLLAFARKGKFVSAPVDLHAVVGEVVELLRHSIDKRIEIAVDQGARPAATLGDPAQLQSAILNLAINAADAMPTGGRLTIATADAELAEDAALLDLPQGRYVQLSVTDTGVGMTVETQRRIFEPFFTTKEQGKGTGLGLASVYGTVRNHRGAVSVRSEAGKGSTFTLFLPLHAEATAATPKQIALPLRGRGHVLVVDDEPLVAHSAADMLRSLGYAVTVRHSGAEAAAFYRDFWRNVDLALLDMVMPGMDGRATFAALRAINPGLKALLTSGYGVDGEAQRILDSGVMGFVQKPYRLEELGRAVRAISGPEERAP